MLFFFTNSPTPLGVQQPHQFSNTAGCPAASPILYHRWVSSNFTNSPPLPGVQQLNSILMLSTQKSHLIPPAEVSKQGSSCCRHQPRVESPCDPCFCLAPWGPPPCLIIHSNKCKTSRKWLPTAWQGTFQLVWLQYACLERRQLGNKHRQEFWDTVWQDGIELSGIPWYIHQHGSTLNTMFKGSSRFTVNYRLLNSTLQVSSWEQKVPALHPRPFWGTVCQKSVSYTVSSFLSEPRAKSFWWFRSPC